MNTFMNSQFMQVANEILKENNKTLKSLFKGKISGNFLIKIKSEVINELGAEFPKLFPVKFDNALTVTGLMETPEYDICRMIVGVHKHHSIFLTKEEIRKNQDNRDYQKMIVSEVVEKVRLHHFSNVFFRKRQLITGDEFLYFPVPYELFTLCIRFDCVLSKSTPEILIYYVDIINNALSVLTLLENNLLSNAYPSCRGMIEQYIKMLILQMHPKCIEAYSKFCHYEIEQSCCNQKFPEEFLCLYNNRVLPAAKSKIEYLHYGWLDNISTYTETNNRYSLYGIIEYLKKNADDELFNALNQLTKLYKGCHAYAHGSSMNVKYPLLNYFELSIMLYYVVKDVFLYLHKEFGIEMCEEDALLIQNLDRDFELLHEQYQMRTSENFELYYGG